MRTEAGTLRLIPALHYSYITEGSPFQYTFFVLQDIPGLIDLLHGPGPFTQRLDDLFRLHSYDHGNEPSHHLAYLYDNAGVPSKTQEHVHELMSAEYRDSLDGLAGNDDAGQMSAWYVMSALGFYAVTPGTAQYSIGTPHFDDMKIQLDNGRFLHICAAGAEAGKFYVKSVRLNGQLLDGPFLRHADLEQGGELVFEMSDAPAQT